MTQTSETGNVDLAASQGMSLLDVAQFLKRHAVRIAVWVLLACGLAGGVVLGVRAGLPNTVIASQTIRFTFTGCDRGEYPNGMPFSPKDLLAAPVLEQVRTGLGLPKDLTSSEFASRITIYQSSRELQLLEMEYQQKLGNSKLSQPERESLEREYKAKADALRDKIFMVSFDATGLGLSAATCEQVVSKIPEAWAAFSQTTKGVKDYDLPIVTAVALSSGEQGDYLVQAELLRSTSRRLSSAAKQLQGLPGGNLVRDSRKSSLSDLSDEVEANYRIRVLPNYINYLRLAFRAEPERVREVFDTRIETQGRAVALSKSRAESIAEAFRAYLSLNAGGTVPAGTVPAGSGGSPALGLGGQMPAIMSLSEGFFDKVIAQGIQSKDVEYRQKLNERQIESALSVLESQDALDFDKWMLKQVAESPQASPPMLERVQADAKVTAEQLQAFAARLAEFHRLLSERNLNAASQLYRNEDPITVVSSNALSLARMVSVTVAAGAVAFFLAVLSGLGADRARLRAAR